MPVMLAIQEAEIRKIVVQSQSRQIVHEILFRKKKKKLKQKKAGRVAKGVGPEFKPQYCKKKKKRRIVVPASLDI
jgi:hypothetical protein